MLAALPATAGVRAEAASLFRAAVPVVSTVRLTGRAGRAAGAAGAAEAAGAAALAADAGDSIVRGGLTRTEGLGCAAGADGVICRPAAEGLSAAGALGARDTLGADSRGAEGAEGRLETAGWDARGAESERASERPAGTALSRAEAGTASSPPIASSPANTIHFLHAFSHIASLLSPAGKSPFFCRRCDAAQNLLSCVRGWG